MQEEYFEEVLLCGRRKSCKQCFEEVSRTQLFLSFFANICHTLEIWLMNGYASALKKQMAMLIAILGWARFKTHESCREGSGELYFE
jgi:hypothetical protein